MLATKARISVMAWGEKESGESAEKQSSALHGMRIRTITRAYLENVGSQFLSLQQDSIEHNNLPFAYHETAW